MVDRRLISICAFLLVAAWVCFACARSNRETDASVVEAGDAHDSMDTGNSIDGSDSSVQLAEVRAYISAFNEEFCRWAVQCESRLGLPALQVLTCHPRGTLRYGDDIVALVSDGRMRFDLEAAAACLTAMTTSTCADPFLPTVCLNALEGSSSTGDPCLVAEDCLSRDLCDGVGCERVCTARPHTGDPCSTRGTPCIDSVCIDGACMAYAAEGESCGVRPCGNGLICVTSGPSRVCAPLGAVDDPCTTPSGCTGNLICTCTSPGCVERRCALGANEGDACAPDVLCQVGLRCVGERCVPVSLPGGSCVDDSRCPEGFFCAVGSCEPKPALGDTCAVVGCVEGICVDGRCELGSVGAACDPFSTALNVCDGFCECDDAACMTAHCTAPGTEGQLCAFDSCAESLVCLESSRGWFCEPVCE